MKYLVKLFVVTYFVIASTPSYSEQKIVVLDMNYILNQSNKSLIEIWNSLRFFYFKLARKRMEIESYNKYFKSYLKL